MGRTSVITRARSRWRRLPRWVRWPALGGAAALTLAVGLLAVLWFTVELPEEPPSIDSAVVLAAGGEELAVLSKDGQRFEVPLEEVAPVVVDALLAAEDRRFYAHTGVDPVGIVRALWTNVRTDRTAGGSTLTQQLVKNQYLSNERTLWRKAREAVLSVKLERTADKDEILERYLNTVYFGRGAYGIEAAARNYFDTSAAELDAGQAALLVGLLRSPETADPVEDPEEAEARRASVLQDLVETGHLTEDEARAAAEAPIDAVPRTDAVTLTAELAPHFVEWVREQTIQAVGEDAIYSSGLRVITTLDLKAQAAAETAVAEVLTDPAGPQAALVALDEDGAIRAHVGGRDFDALQVDLVRGADGGGSGRQPGSTFKPFVLDAALGEGMTLADRFPGPASIDLEVDGEPWPVENYGGSGYGTLTLAEATASSVNTVYAQMVAQVGPAAVVESAQRLGIDAELEAFPSVALGVEEVSPLDLASAYLTLADDGVRVEPYGIVRIEDRDGNVLWEPDRAEPERVVEEGRARAVTHALRGVIEGGTGTAADIGRPAAGKTGTTQDNVDAWFAGYVPGYASVVWMGYPDPAPMDDVQGRSVTGGSFPAQIWSQFMAVAVEDREAADFPAPPDDLLRPSPRPQPSPDSSIDPEDTTTTSEEDDGGDDKDDEKGKDDKEDKDRGKDDDNGGDDGTTTSTAPSGSSSTTSSSTTSTTAPTTSTTATPAGDGGSGGDPALPAVEPDPP